MNTAIQFLPAIVAANARRERLAQERQQEQQLETQQPAENSLSPQAKTELVFSPDAMLISGTLIVLAFFKVIFNMFMGVRKQ